MPINKLSEENARNTDRSASGKRREEGGEAEDLSGSAKPHPVTTRQKSGEPPLGGAEAVGSKATPHAGRGLQEP